MALYTLEERLRILLERIAHAERRAAAVEDYAERTCRVYHDLYRKHAERLDALERKVSGQ